MLINILYKLFTFKSFLVVVVPTLVVIIIRLLLIKYGFDISDLVNNFYTCSVSLLLLNLIRFIIRGVMENFTMPIYLLYDNPNSNSLGEGSTSSNAPSGSNQNPDQNSNQNQNPNQNQNQNSNQNVGQPIYYGNGFSFDGQVYTINDPTNVRNRGFLDPITMRPFNMSYQPYATNLSNAMAHAVQNNNPTQGMDPSIYGYNATRFYSEFMRYTYPNRDPNQY
jgi:hypothetical protein